MIYYILSKIRKKLPLSKKTDYTVLDFFVTQNNIKNAEMVSVKKDSTLWKTRLREDTF